MTLYRQIVAGMLAVFIVLIGSVFAIEFNTTRNYLIQQQRSEMNNTINTVGLALAPYLEVNDKVAVESVINALFDGSSYSAVKLHFLDNDEEIVRSYKVVASGVPDWFISLDLLKKLHDKRVITSGWMQLAEVEIISHPGDAYEQLWAALIKLSTVFFGIFVIGITAIALILKKALNPLHLITERMREIEDNQFGKPLERPSTTDLVAVVDGINHMSGQIEKNFKAQAREAQQLRERAFIDPVSKLGNRALFMGQLTQWLAESSKGGVALLQAKFIKETYDESGYEAGDNLVREVAGHLNVSSNIPSATIARIGNDEFALILPDIDEEELRSTADSIMNDIKNATLDPIGLSTNEAFLGLVYNENKKTNTEILSLVDNALSKAASSPEEPYGLITEQSDQVMLGKKQWLALVEEAIASNAIKFKYQPAKYADRKIFHKEVFSAIEIGDDRYTANQYLFALEQLNMGYVFDQYVIEQMVNKLDSGELFDALAINLTVSSVVEPSFIRWLTKLLTKYKNLASKLHFEIPEVCFVHHQHHTALLCHAIKTSGAMFGVDNYGRHFHSLEYISEFRPNYVKLDYLYTHQIEDEKQRYTLTSISRTAHDLGITTIASRVETQEQLDTLSENYVEAFQGFIFYK
ncbi:EAL domain-containing protein [Vibrio sp. JC009]|uniref:bifunctional diguanylate cyclase/phosphodiesterase n=1 Tax=Vibrio sp. JC009 TaxID=2912314 RepID=UPI0023B08215|nr:EAL domain-containing protein [Vibrio sp. JC009]WED23553.1 EAL domain-containing protein [Vibrio sp. JC009]